MPSCWVEVNLDALRHNFHVIRNLVGHDTTIIAVIKANAYGHGAVEVGRALTAEGARYLAITRVDEALPLRAAGVLTPILLLTPALPEELEQVVTHRLTACLSSYEDAESLSAVAAKMKATARVQLKVNTGMGRLGVEQDVAVEVATQIAQLPNLQLEAAFTHFAQAAGKDTTVTHLQYSKFQPLVHYISRAANIPPQNFHCANSAALLRFPSMRLSCVRPGTILYGQFPSALVAESAMQQRLELRDTFAVKARIIAVKTLQPGQSVGYGSEWTARQTSRIATIAVGYADGLSQEPQTHYVAPHVALRQTLREATKQAAQMGGLKAADTPRTVLLRGQRLPIIGRISMQQCSIDITGLTDVIVGEEVTVFMRRTSAGAHLPRIYVHDPDQPA
ncbi:MAG: alanine racemase [Abitibacteriaceae bacterium]|nr:alanine racemase [Abditibacteriaceae bacterium]MBV9864804.1 alanine racemase [Abditibacteriaceae bacterium]